MNRDSLSSDVCPLDVIKQRAPGFKPQIGLILGSGLGEFASILRDRISIPYSELPGFGECTVAGHKGILHLGYINQTAIACLQGRAHYYEGVPRQAVFTLVRTLKTLGCETLVLTNAAGSLRAEVGPGEVVLIQDHINLQGFNPLIGPNDENFGPRFVDLQNAYDAELRNLMIQLANLKGIVLTEGVYLAVSGPTFETPAEIKAYRILGADLVGMSTVPEVIVARHCGMKVMALSAVTNLAAGMSAEHLSHEHTLEGAQLASQKLFALLESFFTAYGH